MVIRQRTKWISLSIQIVAIWTIFIKDIWPEIIHMFLKFICACCPLKTDPTCFIYLYVTYFSFQPYEFWWCQLLKSEFFGSWSFMFVFVLSVVIPRFCEFFRSQYVSRLLFLLLYMLQRYEYLSDAQMVATKIASYDNTWWVLVEPNHFDCVVLLGNMITWCAWI